MNRIRLVFAVVLFTFWLALNVVLVRVPAPGKVFGYDHRPDYGTFSVGWPFEFLEITIAASKGENPIVFEPLRLIPLLVNLLAILVIAFPLVATTNRVQSKLTFSARLFVLAVPSSVLVFWICLKFAPLDIHDPFLLRLYGNLAILTS